MKYDSGYVKQLMTDVRKLPEDIVELKGGFYKKFQEEDFKLLESERSQRSYGVATIIPKPINRGTHLPSIISLDTVSNPSIPVFRYSGISIQAELWW